MGTLEEQVGRNEAIFRQVNERMAEASGELDVSRLEIVCECADPACATGIVIDLDDYRRARAEPAVFIGVPEHARPAAEDVLFAGEGVVFVRKRRQAAEAAERASS